MTAFPICSRASMVRFLRLGGISVTHDRYVLARIIQWVPFTTCAANGTTHLEALGSDATPGTEVHVSVRQRRVSVGRREQVNAGVATDGRCEHVFRFAVHVVEPLTEGISVVVPVVKRILGFLQGSELLHVVFGVGKCISASTMPQAIPGSHKKSPRRVPG